MILRFLILFCFISSTVVPAQNNGFSLKGKTADINDGTYLYLRDLVNGGNIDSALVKDNSFRFTTDLPEPTLFTMLFTKDKTYFTEVWLEDQPMTFDASNVNFREAKVTGSRNHTLFKKMNEEVYADVMDVDKEIIKQREQEFIKQNPDALVSVFILYGNQKWNQNETGEYFSVLSEEVRTSSLGQIIAKDLEKDLPEIGDRYLDFSIPNTQGDILQISEHQGKLTLLQFWSSGCGFSRTMNRSLSDLYEKYQKEGFEIVGISRDINKENWLGAIREDGTSWPQVSNLKGKDGEVFEAYGVHATPSNFLVDIDGKIIGRNLRGEELEKKVKEYLSK